MEEDFFRKRLAHFAVRLLVDRLEDDGLPVSIHAGCCPDLSKKDFQSSVVWYGCETGGVHELRRHQHHGNFLQSYDDCSLANSPEAIGFEHAFF